MMHDPVLPKYVRRIRAPLRGVPVEILEQTPKRQLRVTAEKVSAGSTIIRLQSYRPASEQGPYAGDWLAQPHSLRVPLWQVEELIAALETVAEATREQQRNGHAR